MSASRYKGFIVESPNNCIQGLYDKLGDLYVGIYKWLYRYNSKLELVYSYDSCFSFSLHDDGVWIDEASDKSKRSTFLDIYNAGYNYKNINKKIEHSSINIGHKIISANLDWGDEYLFVIDKCSGELISNDGEYYYYAFSDGLIYAREREKGIFCFDCELNKLWHQELGGHSYSKANQTPMFHDELVILNQSKSILAFNKETGDRVWECELKQPPNSFYVANGRVYLGDLFHIVILDANTGEEIVREVSGYKTRKDVLGRVENEIVVYPVGEMLYVYGLYENEIKFFSSDAKTCLQSLPLHHTGYGVRMEGQPVIRDMKILQSVSNGRASASNGLLILSPVENAEEAVIVKQPRLTTRIYAVPSLQEPHVQRIYIEGDKIDDICRFAGIAIKELQYETGVIPIYSEKYWSLDRNHNGIIELVVDTERLGDDAEHELGLLIDELNESFDDESACSGDGKHLIKVMLILQKRTDWDEQGDLIDVDKIREIRKPIS